MKDTGNYNKDYSYEGQTQPNQEKRPNDNKVWGMVIIIFGVYLLLKTVIPKYFPFLDNIVSAPLLMIIGGLFLGSRRKFQMGGWVFLTAAGIFLLVNRLDSSLTSYLFPLALILLGIFIIQNKKVKFNNNNIGEQHQIPSTITSESEEAKDSQTSSNFYDTAETLRIQNIFGSERRNVLSKNFKGGNVVSIFGGVEIDLRSADTTQDIQINATVIFGEIELLVPANWQIINEATTILGAVEDLRRIINSEGDLRKVYLTGTVVFGNIEIKNI